MENTLIEFEITSNCICHNYDEETGEFTESNNCFGCFDDEKANFKYEVLQPWLEANGWNEDTAVYVYSGAMLWNNVAGWTNIRASEVIDCLTLNGDFTLRYRLDGKDLTCVRSSHDELGALFTFSKAKETDDDDE